MYRTDEPLDDFNRYEEDRQRELDQLPVCSQCDEPIQSTFCWEIGNKVFCETCVEHFKKYTTDLM